MLGRFDVLCAGNGSAASVDAFSDIKLRIDLSDGEEEPDNMSKERRPKNRKTVLIYLPKIGLLQIFQIAMY